MKICLVRTGQTAWDAEERVRGKMDVPLTEAGRHAAATAAAALTGVGLEAVYCAPDEAARATADLLAKALDLSPRRLEALAGIDFGLWAGMSWAEVAQRHPKAYRHLMEAPLMVRPPGGESIDEALRRVRSAVEHLTERHPDDAVALVCSGEICGLVRACAEGGEVPALVPVDAAAPTWLVIEVPSPEPTR